MPLIPERLHPGDLISLIAPASAPPDPATVDASVARLESFGFKVRLGKHARKRHGFIAGVDKDRADDIMRSFTDPKIKGIVCIRGGYGTPRLLPLLDYAAIRRHPKVFIGYSDITGLHCAFLKKSNLLSFHGPMGSCKSMDETNHEYSRKRWLQSLMDPKPLGSICAGYDGPKPEIVRRGKASGELIGGNLSLIQTLTGTQYLPNFRNRILFLEDVDEKPYRFDRMLTHLLLAGLLQQVAGVAVGLCEQCHDPRAVPGGEFRQTLADVIRERLAPLKVPVVMNLPFGHVPANGALPVGARVTLDADQGDLIINSSAVK